MLNSEIAALKAALKADFCPTCKRPFEKATEDNRHIAAEIEGLDKKLVAHTAEVSTMASGFASDNAEFAGEIRDLEAEVKKLRLILNAGKDEEVTYSRRLREYERSCAVIQTKFESECALINKRHEGALSNYGLAKNG